MIWNEETRRLEFEDGTPVGARALNDARVARGKKPARAHLQETPECVARREEELQSARNEVKRRLKGHKWRGKEGVQWINSNRPSRLIRAYTPAELEFGLTESYT